MHVKRHPIKQSPPKSCRLRRRLFYSTIPSPQIHPCPFTDEYTASWLKFSLLIYRYFCHDITNTHFYFCTAWLPGRVLFNHYNSNILFAWYRNAVPTTIKSIEIINIGTENIYKIGIISTTIILIPDTYPPTIIVQSSNSLFSTGRGKLQLLLVNFNRRPATIHRVITFITRRDNYTQKHSQKHWKLFHTLININYIQRQYHICRKEKKRFSKL